MNGAWFNMCTSKNFTTAQHDNEETHKCSDPTLSFTSSRTGSQMLASSTVPTATAGSSGVYCSSRAKQRLQQYVHRQCNANHTVFEARRHMLFIAALLKAVQLRCSCT
jgi:hypothetical protein